MEPYINYMGEFLFNFRIGKDFLTTIQTPEATKIDKVDYRKNL